MSQVLPTPSPLVPRSPPVVNVPSAPGLGFGRFAPNPGSPATPFNPDVILNANASDGGPTDTLWVKPEPASPVFSEASSIASGRTSVGPPPMRNNGAAAGTSVRRNNQAPQRPRNNNDLGGETWRDSTSTRMADSNPTSQTGKPAKCSLTLTSPYFDCLRAVPGHSALGMSLPIPQGELGKPYISPL